MITTIIILSVITVLLFLVWLLFDVDNISFEIVFRIPQTIVLSIIAIIVLAIIVIF